MGHGFLKGFCAAWRLTRPHTLAGPAIGMASGSMVALGTMRGKGRGDGEILLGSLAAVLAGLLLAALLAAAGNAVNQVFDLAGDRVHRPGRPLPAGEVTVAEAWILAAAAGAAALGIAWALNPATFIVAALSALVLYAYAGPPFRTKRFWWAAGPTIAAWRGTLLFVAGWTAVDGDARIGTMLLRVLAAMFGLFVLGAATTEGRVTIPPRFGVLRSAWIIAPFLVLPWLLLVVGVVAHGNTTPQGWFHAGLGVALAGWGATIVRRLLRDADGSRPSWRHACLLLAASHVGVATGFWLPR